MPSMSFSFQEVDGQIELTLKLPTVPGVDNRELINRCYVAAVQALAFMEEPLSSRVKKAEDFPLDA